MRDRIATFFRTKRGIALLIAIGSACILSSYGLPYWNLTLEAPQYPKGLHLQVYMSHVEGDVQEVNILNHYIGMKSLDDAAKFERRFAWLGLLAFALGAFLILPLGRKSFKVLFIPPVLFLVVFVADLFYWLHDAGHDLNPDAPVTIEPFTPVLLGRGEIGQFTTHAFFGSGFGVSLFGIAIILYAITKKKVSCRGCDNPQGCNYVCNRAGAWFHWRQS